MSLKTDLHIHSWHSDGTMSPNEIVEKYSKDEFDMIAITDHEVIDGISDAEEAGKEKNLRVIPGIEIAAEADGTELHILGYYFDPKNEELRAKLAELADIRRNRNEKMLKALQNMGCNISEKDLIQREGQTYIGKPNFARALIAKGYISSVSQAFEDGKFLESDEIKAIKREKPTAAEVIELIKNAGGIAVLGHPYKIKNLGERESDDFKVNFEELLKTLRTAGLRGLECIYPKHSHEEKMFFISMASKYHLHITEGSDFHGDR